MAPDNWSRDLVTRTGFKFAVRPAESADEAALGAFFTHVAPENLRFRFLTGFTTVGNHVGAVTSIEHGLTENFLAFGKDQSDIIAIATLACDEAMQVGEVAIAIRSDHKSRGISCDFLVHLAACAQAKGLTTVRSVEIERSSRRDRHGTAAGFMAAPYPGDSSLTIVQRQSQADWCLISDGQVLRNGVEIGSSPVDSDGPVTATEAFTLNSVDTSGVHWLRLPLPGQPISAAPEKSASEHARAHFPEALRTNILSIIRPGTTLLVTRDSLKSAGTGKNLTVLASDTKWTVGLESTRRIPASLAQRDHD